MAKGWLNYNGGWYYLKPDGSMAANEWYVGSWFDADGVNRYPGVGSWRQDARGYWFGDTLGWYARGGWVMIDGTSYQFDQWGYLVR